MLRVRGYAASARIVGAATTAAEPESAPMSAERNAMMNFTMLEIVSFFIV